MIESRLAGHWIYDEQRAKRDRELFEAGYERGFEDGKPRSSDGVLIALFTMAACFTAFIIGCVVGGAL